MTIDHEGRPLARTGRADDNEHGRALHGVDAFEHSSIAMIECTLLGVSVCVQQAALWHEASWPAAGTGLGG